MVVRPEGGGSGTGPRGVDLEMGEGLTLFADPDSGPSGNTAQKTTWSREAGGPPSYDWLRPKPRHQAWRTGPLTQGTSQPCSQSQPTRPHAETCRTITRLIIGLLTLEQGTTLPSGSLWWGPPPWPPNIKLQLASPSIYSPCLFLALFLCIWSLQFVYSLIFKFKYNCFTILCFSSMYLFTCLCTTDFT